MGIDRQRIVDNFYPARIRRSPTTSRPAPSRSRARVARPGTFDATAAKALLAEGLTEEGIDPATFTTKLSYRPPVRGYLPDPPTIAQEIASQLQTNLGITVTLDQQESGTYLDNNAAGMLDGLFILGWGADYPDASNFMDYHFGQGAGKKFGDSVSRSRRRGDQGWPVGRRCGPAGRLHHRQRPHPPARARSSSWRTAAPPRRSRRTSRVPIPRPSRARSSRS